VGAPRGRGSSILVIEMITTTPPQTLAPPRRRLPAHVLRAVAVAAQTDPRTVARVVAGQPTQPSTRDRILRALHDRAEAERMRGDQ
jgi:hypothetical protein